MSIRMVNPYILFNGTAEKAIKLYESALGAKTERLARYGDVPPSECPAPAQKDHIMHATLSVGEGVLMVSDTTPEKPVAAGGNVEIALHFTETAEMAKAFDALAAGGTVTLPLQDVFWGSRFGMLTDAYGVRWMFSCEHQQS